MTPFHAAPTPVKKNIIKIDFSKSSSDIADDLNSPSASVTAIAAFLCDHFSVNPSKVVVIYKAYIKLNPKKAKDVFSAMKKLQDGLPASAVFDRMGKDKKFLK